MNGFYWHSIFCQGSSNGSLFYQIMAVKKNIEEIQGKDSYPWGQQLLIFNGKVLKDESTLDENKVNEDGFLVVMLSKVGF